ncbi:Sir2 silent information regulator family NAD-dependent deacetylase [Companilactobacillus furfuricola]|uniref:Sir2 silent information regulator family NAD-dependent deacetylase n=1 Tax=Companilactobacillus furfuricola TaxID=1462575 RepID=UPI000F78B5DF|nr:Sir2 silent information regulator family NAD-dependent deacetylase [Companilactobacillus furfuricola]
MKQIEQLTQLIDQANAILVGGGSGLSNAAGMDFWYEASPLFMEHMKYFYDKYHFKGLFNGFYNPFDSEEEHWAFMLLAWKMIFDTPAQKPTYQYLGTLVANKPAHYITTNQDSLFKQYFPEEQVSEIQGSHYFAQSKDTSDDKNLYSMQKIVADLLPKIKDHRLPKEYFPTSKINGSPLIVWARGPEFLEDKRYNDEYQKISRFLGQHQGEKILFLEMGVGRMTPMFIQEPFWEMTNYMPDSFYVNINPKDAITAPEIKDRSLLISEDINEVLKEAANIVQGGQNG